MGASCTLYSPSQNSAVTLKVGLVPQQNTTPSLKCSSFLKKASTTTKLSLINLQVEMQRQCCCACGPWSAALWFLIFTRWSEIQIVHYQEICAGPTVAWFQVDWASVQCSAGCEGIGTWWSEHLAWKYWTPLGRLQHQHYNAHVVWEQNCMLTASSIGYCCWIEDYGSWKGRNFLSCGGQDCQQKHCDLNQTQSALLWQDFKPSLLKVTSLAGAGCPCPQWACFTWSPRFAEQEVCESCQVLFPLHASLPKTKDTSLQNLCWRRTPIAFVFCSSPSTMPSSDRCTY